MKYFLQKPPGLLISRRHNTTLFTSTLVKSKNCLASLPTQQNRQPEPGFFATLLASVLRNQLTMLIGVYIFVDCNGMTCSRLHCIKKNAEFWSLPPDHLSFFSSLYHPCVMPSIYFCHPNRVG